MEGEGDPPIYRKAGLGVAVKDLEIDILVEGAGQPVARGGKDAPSLTGFGRKRDCGLLGGIAQPEEGQRLEGSVEQDRSAGRPPPHL
jgi:hypothetical protein